MSTILAILQRIRSVFGYKHTLFKWHLNATDQPKHWSWPWPSTIHTALLSLYKSLHTPLSALSQAMLATIHRAHRLLFPTPPPLPYDTYATPEDEERYWRSAERGLAVLRQSDARFVGADRPKRVRVPELPPLVMYYVPALLPQYRDAERNRKEVDPEELRKRRRMRILEPEEYCQWHRMVFPDRDHPDEEDAKTLIPRHCTRELRKIRQIARLLPRMSYRRRPQPLFASKYQVMWREWRKAYTDSLKKKDTTTAQPNDLNH